MSYYRSSSDPVLSWISGQFGETTPLLYETVIHFDMGPLLVRSNVLKIIEHLQSDFTFYKRGKKLHKGHTLVEMEIYCFEKEKGGIRLNSSLQLRGSRSVQSPDNSYEEGEYIFIATDYGQAIWRRYDLLVSMPKQLNSPMRIVLCSPERRRKRGALKLKRTKAGSGIDLVELTDLVTNLYAQRRGTFCLHGAVLERDGRGLLITGPSGSGKTTTALALLATGWSLLCDELAIVVPSPKGLPKIGGVFTPPRLSFPEITCVRDIERAIGGTYNDIPKRSITIPDHFLKKCGGKPVQIDNVIFLDPRRGYKHALEPCSVLESFSELMKQVVALSGREQRLLHISTLIELTTLSGLYRLYLGPDIESLCRLLANFQGKGDAD